MVGQPGVEGIGGADLEAGEAQVEAQLTGQPRQEVTAADIREEADADFRHAHLHPLADHPQGSRLGQAHATAEDEAVE
ncbi:hypothetical protein D9M68_913590 [compost metagenome]